MSLWQKCKNKIQPVVLRGDLIRVVESQEQIATSQLVDSLEEQIQLEELLEQSKPDYRTNLFQNNSNKKNTKRHYLLTTPFRYPPLYHGSRFGNRFEPSLFYASKSITTAFSETAYYRFYFWQGMNEAPPSGKYITEHTVFSVGYYSTAGLKLQNAPFKEYEKELTDPSHYKVTQELGNEMRSNGIEVFEYVSARDLKSGINVALFQPNGLAGEKPREQQQWLCETTAEKVSFSSKEGELFSYPIEGFLRDSVFPLPAY